MSHAFAPPDHTKCGMCHPENSTRFKCDDCESICASANALLAEAPHSVATTRASRSRVAPAPEPERLYVVETEVPEGYHEPRTPVPLMVVNTEGKWQYAASVYQFIMQEVNELLELLRVRATCGAPLIAAGRSLQEFHSKGANPDLDWENSIFALLSDNNYEEKQMAEWVSAEDASHHRRPAFVQKLFGCMSERFATCVAENVPELPKDVEALACTAKLPRIFIGKSRRVIPLWRVEKYLAVNCEAYSPIAEADFLPFMQRLVEGYGLSDQGEAFGRTWNTKFTCERVDSVVELSGKHPHRLLYMGGAESDGQHWLEMNELLEIDCDVCGREGSCPYVCCTDACQYKVCQSCVDDHKVESSIEMFHGAFHSGSESTTGQAERWVLSPFKGGMIAWWETEAEHNGNYMGQPKYETTWPRGVDEGDVTKLLELDWKKPW